MRAAILCRFAAVALLAVLGGCAIGEPLEVVNEVDEIPPGPGLFSGDDGQFVIYSR